MASRLKGKPPSEVERGHSKILIYGAPKTGKTIFALGFPSPYFIDCEGGARHEQYVEKLKASGGVYFGPDEGAQEFDTVMGEIQTLATEKHRFRTFVLDSSTKIYQSRIARDAERLGEKDAFGASKKPAIAQMRRLVSWLPKLNMNVVLVAHEVALWGGEGNARKQVGVGPDIWEKLSYELDLTLHFTKAGPGTRRARVQDSRFANMPDFMEFYVQENGKDVGYENFSARYGKKYLEAESVPVVLATPEQVAEIERFVTLLKLDADEIEKVLTKANADAWNELTTEQAAKTLVWLKAKIEGATK